MVPRFGVALYPIELRPHTAGATGLEPATSRVTIDNQTTPARSGNAGHVAANRGRTVENTITDGLRPGVDSVISAYCTTLQDGKYKTFPKCRSPSADGPGRGFGRRRSRRDATAILRHARLPCPGSGQPRIVTPEGTSRIFAGFRRRDRYICRQLAHGFLLKEKGRTSKSKHPCPSRPLAMRNRLAASRRRANLRARPAFTGEFDGQ